MIDSHCHINFSQYQDDFQHILKRALEAGVDQFVIPGTDLETSRSAWQCAQQQENIYSAAGYHPCDVQRMTQSDFAEIAQLVRQESKIVAVGEVGLDFYHDKSQKAIQIECLKQFVDLAQSCAKPLIIHNRDADEEMLALLQDCDLSCHQPVGVFHCFTSSLEFAQDVLNLGFFISFSGIVTFKNAKELQAVARQIPLEKILIETDSPYLAPHPHRGQRNEPAYTQLVCQKIAELKEISVQEVDRITTRNTRQLFKI